jgi:hypothetical protein
VDSERSGDGEIALANLPLSEVRRRQRQVMALLRDAEHWRRLVAARLDLAVAAVTDIDDLVEIPHVAGGGPLPRRNGTAPSVIGMAAGAALGGVGAIDVTDDRESSPADPEDECCPTAACSRLPLRDLLGIPRSEGRLPESALLLQLRDALRELDTYTGSLRSDVEATARLLANRFEDDEEQGTPGHGSIAGS